MKIHAFCFAAALLFFTVPAAVADETVTLTWKRSASDADNTKTASLELGVGESIKALWEVLGMFKAIKLKAIYA